MFFQRWFLEGGIWLKTKPREGDKSEDEFGFVYFRWWMLIFSQTGIHDWEMFSNVFSTIFIANASIEEISLHNYALFGDETQSAGDLASGNRMFHHSRPWFSWLFQMALTWGSLRFLHWNGKSPPEGACTDLFEQTVGQLLQNTLSWYTWLHIRGWDPRNARFKHHLFYGFSIEGFIHLWNCDVFWCGGHEHILVANSVSNLVLQLCTPRFLEVFFGPSICSLKHVLGKTRWPVNLVSTVNLDIRTLSLASSCQKWWAGSFRRREACYFLPLKNQPFGDKPLIVGPIAPVAILVILGSVKASVLVGMTRW